MTYRNLGEPPYFPAKVQFVCSAETPHLVYQACLETGIVSNTAYIQRAVSAALARDLGLDYDELLANHPPNRGPSKHVYARTVRTGPANTVEEVR
jgi:hypothetical protein